MKKIMLNDRFNLTQAVLEGRKTMTRRIEKGLENLEEGNFSFNKYKGEIKLYGEKGSVIEVIKSRYKIGDVVAVSQAYGSNDFCNHIQILHGVKIGTEAAGALIGNYIYLKGWNNKMFVRAGLMPHQIRITDIKVERLQDISDEDCLKEGISILTDVEPMNGYFFYGYRNIKSCYNTPREAFSALIDKVSGKGTWDSNPYVFAYSFELIK